MMLVRRFGLEINTQKSKYILLSHHQNAMQNHDIELANRLFENVAHLKYLKVTVACHVIRMINSRRMTWAGHVA
jgi:hypothetical protein